MRDMIRCYWSLIMDGYLRSVFAIRCPLKVLPLFLNIFQTHERNPMKAICYALIFCALLLGVANASAQTWSKNLLVTTNPSEGGIVFALGPKIYYTGGFNNLKTFAMDTSKRTWSGKSDFPFATFQRIFSTSFSINGKGYVVAGCDSNFFDHTTANVIEYDPDNDKWTKVSQIPTGPRLGCFSFVIDGKAYIGGGTSDFVLFKQEEHLTNEFYEFNPATNVWTKRDDLPMGPAAFQSTFVIDGKGYVVGGEDGSGSMSDCYQYDPATNKWTKKASLPNARHSAIGFAVGGKGYIGLGQTGADVGHNDFYEYDPAKDQWTKASFTHPQGVRSNAVAVAVGPNVYIGTGWDLKDKLFNEFWILSFTVPSGKITLNSPNVDFGKVTINSTKDFDLTIQNTGAAELSISKFEFGGTDAAQFSVKNAPTLPLAVPVGQTKTVTLTYAPTNGGLKNATFKITSNAENNPAKLTIVGLTGEGVAAAVPHITLSLQSANFGDVQLATAKDTSITIKAGSAAPLTINKLEITGSNAFTLKTPPSLPLTIPANGEQKVMVSFKPMTETSYQATLTIGSNAENEQQHLSTVALQGAGKDLNASVQEVAVNSLISLYPNPCRDNTTLTIRDNNLIGRYKATVVNALGQVVIQVGEGSSNNRTQTFNVAQLADGHYWLVIQTASETTKLPFVKVQ